MKPAGLSLIEVLIVISLLAVVSLFGISRYQNAQTNQILNAAARELRDTMESARIFSQSYRKERSWGVAILDSRTYALISKPASGPAEQEETKTVSQPVALSGSTTVLFEAGSGHVATPQSMELTVHGLPAATVSVDDFGFASISFP